MLSVRLIGFLFMFILLLSDCCSGHSHLDMKKNKAAEAMAFYNGVPTAAEVENTKLVGRKMMSRKSMGKEIMKEEVLNQKDAAISGAAHSIGNCKRKKKGSNLNVECKLASRSHGTDHHEKVKMASLAAFSADYHVPKPHPPRNN